MFARLHTAAIGLCLVCFTTQGIADEKKLAPEQIPGTTRINAEGLIDLAEQLPELIIVDARISMDRHQGYIEDSLSLPDIKTSCATLKTIIPNKQQPALFYCNGIKCGRSVKSIKIAQQCGYKKIYWFRGGFEEWKDKGFPFIKE